MRMKRALAVAVLSGLCFGHGIAQAAPNVDFSGTGSQIVDLGSIKKSVIIEFSFDETGSVVIDPVFAKGKSAAPWIETDAPLSGGLFAEKHSSAIVGVRVVAPDQWTLRVVPLGAAAKVTSGTTPKVIQLVKMTKSDSTRTFSYQGSGNVVVFPISAKGMSGFPVVNSSGVVKKKVTLPRGTKYISIWANGPWKIVK
jgi:uncharacterized FAD-dependent dehydrogenase